MRKLISIVLALTVFMSMCGIGAFAADLPAGADVLAADDLASYEEAGLKGTNAALSAVSGLLGKADTDESIKSAESAITAKYYYTSLKNGNEEVYLKDGNKMEGYIVIDFNVYTDDAQMNMIRLGLSGRQHPLFPDIKFTSLKADQWNHIRYVYRAPETVINWENNMPDVAENEAAVGSSVGFTKAYINGVAVGNEVETLVKADDATTTKTNFNQPINEFAALFMHSNDATAIHHVYLDDVKIYRTANDPGAPKSPEITASEKLFADNAAKVLYYTEDITVADIAAANAGVEVVGFDDAAYTNQLGDDVKLTENNVVSVKSADGVYSTYTIKSNKWIDLRNNTYTWTFDAVTGTLRIGAVSDDSEKGDKANYGKIKMDNGVGTDAIGFDGRADLRPWHNFRTKVTNIEMDSAITVIGRQMFDGFTALKSVVIPKQINGNEWGEFNGCTALETVVFEEGSTWGGGQKSFNNCTKLNNVKLASSTTSLSNNTYFGCTSLTELFIPAAVSSGFSKDLFSSASKVTLKYYKNTPAASRIEAKTDWSAQITKEPLDPKGTFIDAEENEGSIGWEIDAEGTLHIYDIPTIGTGNMPTTNSDIQYTFPWNNISGINNVVVENGITHLGWNTINYGPALESVTVSQSVRSAAAYAFNSLTTDKFIFEEGCMGVFGSAQTLNRSVKINNLYMPSTAKGIHTNLWRALDNSSGDVYVGLENITIHAPKGSDALAWANARKANPAKDKSNGKGGIDVTINVTETEAVERVYVYNKTAFDTDKSFAANNGKAVTAVGADGEYDSSFALYSTVDGQNNVFISGASFDRDNVFSKKAYAVFEADIKFGANGKHFFFGSDQHKHVGDSAIPESALVKDGWNKVVTVVDYNTGVSKTYVNGIYAATTNESALWKDGDYYTVQLKDKDGKVTGTEDRICTSTRFVAYDLNGISDVDPVVYVDNMAIYATDVNPADAYAAPLTHSAYDAVNGVTFTASNDVKSLDSNIVIVAAYNGDDMIGNVVIGTDSVTITPVDGATKYVGYVWNSIEGLAPIAASVTVPVQ